MFYKIKGSLGPAALESQGSESNFKTKQGNASNGIFLEIPLGILANSRPQLSVIKITLVL